MPLEPSLPDWFAQLGLMAWPLAACSVVVLAVCLERTVFTLRCRMGRDVAYGRLADAMNAHRPAPKLVRDEVAQLMLGELERAFTGGVKLLRIIGTISPMLGLLGTILGIISAFRSIAAQTGPVSPNMIAEGLWEAMLTTAVGLMIALPALLLAHLFKHLGERRLADMAYRLNCLSLSFELEAHGLAEPAETAPGRRRGVKGVAA